ncbi:4-hydroxy-tetrahydrodipicolinate reductase [Candidatus Gracilibacteria bacterium]|nr:4-hydroxy-tetrahydrodipicolinate reductase [Candidatus Gracilibacteria bacterium]
MKLVHIGLGGMGKTVQTIAQERGHQSVGEIEVGDEIDTSSLGNCDLAIECTVPKACVGNIRKVLKAGKDCLVITTGWYDEMDEVREMVEKSGVRFLYASNFSIGVNLYFRVVEEAAKLINLADEYDVWGHEIHHKNKVDSPSGTAKTLETILLQNIDRKKRVVEEKLDRKIEDDELHFSSVRGGMVNFGHTIGFDSSSDCIKIEHFARNRDGYALGAIKCAEWLLQQKPGFYTMDDFLKSVFK